ncbi:hypothetical protein CDS [Salmonella enterica subsp. enterica serovar Derby]|uniref:Uncharacterized protein n=1 Tax=Salmonella paratyphi C (strain RKS4594) TaxID=476213 RepID=C0Q102_SALPC|nr:hypothetical protein SPC_1572 [Salmonella enterica subsp. enterica serovar Paratyphi C str. RKS4594]VXG74578.1 hypothetical protein CDS [Salmonella enterica subsp. enterica serovar Derby]
MYHCNYNIKVTLLSLVKKQNMFDVNIIQRFYEEVQIQNNSLHLLFD